MRRLLLGAFSTILLAGGPVDLLKVRTTVRFETLRLPHDEPLSLLGLASTADLGPFYLGPGLYGAVRGGRGGFFTFGLEGGIRVRTTRRLPVEWDAGLFLGGGGGASAPQGGGLMVRPHLGMALYLGNVRLGAEVSRVRFPNGGIDSTQGALTVGFSYDRLWVPGDGWGRTFGGGVGWEGRGLALEVVKVDPSGSARTRRGTAQWPLDLAGVSLTADLHGPWFRFLNADGAVRESSSGYAQALGGLGLRMPLSGPVGLEARLAAGMGGGGGLDTGGGFLVAGEGGLTLGIGAWRGTASLGFLKAPGGHFVSRTITLRFAHHFSVPAPMEGDGTLADVDLAGWRMGSGALIYRRAPRQDGPNGPVQMMALRVDRSLSQALYLTGEAASATGGGAGGYSTGLVGAGCQTPAWARQRLFLEAAIGAGGGGGLRPGGGFLTSLRTGWRLQLPRGLELDASVGQVQAPRGVLDATTYGLGLHLRFATLIR